MKLTKSKIKFKVDGIQIEFSIIHNLPDVFGLSINAALDNWLARTNKFTAKSFVNYINSKETQYIAMTADTYNRVLKYGDE